MILRMLCLSCQRNDDDSENQMDNIWYSEKVKAFENVNIVKFATG